MALYIRLYNGTSMDEEQVYNAFTLPLPDVSGWIFKGWAINANTSETIYGAGDVISAYDYDEDDILDLYAVFQQGEILCYYYRNRYSQVETNVRYRKIRYNINNSAYTEKYNTFHLPEFSSSNQTISPSELSGSWSAIGWRSDTSANVEQYEPYATITANMNTSNFYAVYEKTVSVSYNRNGGSGSMSASTGKSYCNCNTHISKATTKSATIALRSCTFTPPSNKTFSYWSLSSDGTNGNYTNSITTLNDCTLYAIWVLSSIRPQNWAWSTNIQAGLPVTVEQIGTNKYIAIFMPASEWNSFVDRVAAFATYKKTTINSSNYYVESRSEMTADIPISIINIISSLGPSVSAPTVSSGNTITASFFIGLQNYLNSIE